LKPGPQGSTILRVYEATGRPAQGVTIRLASDILEAQEVNLMEDPGRKLDAPGGTLPVDLRPFEIKTFRLVLRPSSS
jgi:alpha-mannosidase